MQSNLFQAVTFPYEQRVKGAHQGLSGPDCILLMVIVLLMILLNDYSVNGGLSFTITAAPHKARGGDFDVFQRENTNAEGCF